MFVVLCGACIALVSSAALPTKDKNNNNEETLIAADSLVVNDLVPAASSHGGWEHGGHHGGHSQHGAHGASHGMKIGNYHRILSRSLCDIFVFFYYAGCSSN